MSATCGRRAATRALALSVSLLGLATARADAPIAPSHASDEVVDVVVVAPRRTAERLRDAPVAVDVIGRREIETSGARDAAGVLVTQAGVQIERSFAGDGLRMQGLEPQHTLIVIDGERLVGARDGALDLTRIYAADIQQIEIVRGPASAVYGSDAMAGVVNIVTRPPDAAVGLAAQGRYGITRGPRRFFSDMPQSGDGWLSATAGSDTLRMRLSAGYRHVASFDRSPETPSTTGPETDTYGGNARLDWLPSERFHLPLFVRVARRNLSAVDQSETGAVYDRTQRSDDLTVTLSPTLRFDEDDALSVSGSYAQQRVQSLRDQRGDDDGDQLEDAREQLATLRTQSLNALGAGLTLTSGVELLGQRFESPRLREIGMRGRVSPFAELAWTLSARHHLALLPSARVDVDSQYGTNVSPRLALRFDPIARLSLRAAIGRGFRAPSFSELYLDFQNMAANYRVRGNEALKPESSIGASVSAELQAADWLGLMVNLFHNELWDLIDSGLVEVTAGESTYSYLNRDRARTQGVESKLRVRVRPLFTFEATYALTFSRDITRDRPLSGRALHRGAGNVVLGGGTAPWTLSARAQLVGRRQFYEDAATGEIATERAAPAYVAIDARAAYQLAEPLALFLVAENLTDAAPVNAPLTPTTFYVGLHASY